LLLDAMSDLQRVALGKIVLRGKEHLVAIRPLDGALCIETMRYADEVIPVESLEGLPGEELEPSKRELDMARQLIEALATDFEPEKFHDEYREQVQELIEKKAAGEEIVAEPMVEEPAKVVDLMAALEQSLARAGKGQAATGYDAFRAGSSATRAAALLRLPPRRVPHGRRRATRTRRTPATPPCVRRGTSRRVRGAPAARCRPGRRPCELSSVLPWSAPPVVSIEPRGCDNYAGLAAALVLEGDVDLGPVRRDLPVFDRHVELGDLGDAEIA
jgi:hypothetical protein